MSTSDTSGTEGRPAHEPLTERLAMASARIPFRLKVAAVWVVIFILLGLFCIAAGFDREWIKDNIKFIAGGLKWTIIMAIGPQLVLVIVLSTFGASAGIQQPDLVRDRRVLRVLLPGHATDRADVPPSTWPCRRSGRTSRNATAGCRAPVPRTC